MTRSDRARHERESGGARLGWRVLSFIGEGPRSLQTLSLDFDRKLAHARSQLDSWGQVWYYCCCEQPQ